MGQRDKQLKETREAIVNSSIQLFSEKGVEGVSMRQISGEAGISVGSLYYHFPNKDALKKEIIKQVSEMVEATMDVDDNYSLESYLMKNVEFVIENKEYSRWIYQLRVHPESRQSFSEPYEKMKSKIISNLRKALKENEFSEAGIESEVFFASMEGLIFHYLFDHKFQLREAAQKLLKLYTT